MKIKIALCILLLLSLITPALAQQPIPADPPARWWKGNLHTHTLWSDGDEFPEMAAEWYHDHGYNFLGLSDHNILSQGARWMRAIDIEKRGGKAPLDKYLTRFGNSWVELRENEGAREVRLKPLTEVRALVEERNKFIMIQMEEVTDKFENSPVHMNVTNLLEVIKPQGGSSVAETIENNFQAANAQATRTGQEMLVHLNHPNFGWGVTAEDLVAVLSEHFFEIYNGHPGVRQLGDSNHPSMDRMWDIANTLRIVKMNSRPLYGLATDDTHHYHYPGQNRSNPGRGWIMARSTHLTPDSLVRAIKAGDFYASTGVTLKDVRFENQTLSIEIEPEPGATYTTAFIGSEKGVDVSSRPAPTTQRVTQVYSNDIGKTFATAPGEKVAYKLTGKELYVRAVITSSQSAERPSLDNQKKQAWTQPVGWNSAK
jgi:hypothetical protein